MERGVEADVVLCRRIAQGLHFIADGLDGGARFLGNRGGLPHSQFLDFPPVIAHQGNERNKEDEYYDCHTRQHCQPEEFKSHFSCPPVQAAAMASGRFPAPAYNAFPTMAPSRFAALTAARE